MIIVKLKGGLGNQMFQYALGRRLAHASGAMLKLDISWFEQDKVRGYGLNAFNIQEHFATPNEVIVKKIEKLSFWEKITLRFKQPNSRLFLTHIKQRHFHFDPAVLHLSDNIYLDGYWQSEKYFKDIEETIRQDFTFKIPQKGRNKELTEDILSSESVCLHIRRGDYITNPKANQFHGVCDVDFYTRSIEEIGVRVKEPYFFIFSDDPEWAREYLKLPYPIVVVDWNNERDAYEDLRLMSLCRHHIIANSSFSWWGAWLNPNPRKLVFAPKQWFKTNKHKDIVLTPEDWIMI